MKPVVAVTVGDPNGVGPEIVLRAVTDEKVLECCVPVVFGSRDVLAHAREVCGLDIALREVEDGRDEIPQASGGVVYVRDIPGFGAGDLRPGQVDARAGESAFRAIRHSIEWMKAGHASAVTCGPASKQAIVAAGYDFPGQTEIYAHLTGTSEYYPVLLGLKYRVYLVTVHVSLRNAIDMITRERVEAFIRRADQTMRDSFGFEKPKVAVAALNPHAGEGGLLGSEEIDAIRPAVEAACADGIDAVGPAPADALFHRAEKGDFDVVIAMYHDQGVIPLKRDGYLFYTDGLPFPRVTVGHGTAYDIARRNMADPGLMIRAIQCAAELGSLRKAAG